MAFHRLAVPSYFGGLPGGYNYINNAIAGTPAGADSAKVGGPNAGTYFVATSEDATSADFNRPAKALAENTDFLDDLLRRDLASPVKTSDVVAGGTVTSIILTGPGIFVGEGGTPNTVEGIRTFAQVVDASDNEIFSGAAECQVTAISPEVPGAGFSAGNVTLTISPGIPTGKTYRVYYYQRSNLATFTAGVLQKAKRRINTSFVPFLDTVRTVTGTSTLHSPSRDATLILNPASSFNLTLPTPSTCTGWKVHLVNGTGTMSTSNKVTLVRAAAEKINNLAASFDLDVAFGGWMLVSDGTDWHIRFLPA